MSIACTEPVAELASTANATSYALDAFTPGANAALVVLVFADGTTAAGSMSGGSLTWTREASVAYNAGADAAYLFWARTGTAPASTTVTFDCTGDAATGCVIMAFQFTGVDPNVASPIRQAKTATGTGSDPSLTFDSALAPANGYCAGFGIPRNPPDATPPTGWTEVADAGHGTPTVGGAGAFRAGGESGRTVTFTSAAGSWGMVGCEVYGVPADGMRRRKAVDRRRWR